MSHPPVSPPFVDEHSVAIEASRDAVWPALLRMVETAAPGRFARFLGCVDTEASGPRPFAVGSAVPGFHVVAVDEPGELALAGRHRYSDYRLIFRLDDLGPDRSRLRAETRAAFPGTLGRLYRMVLMGAGAHAVATRRMLATVRRDAEASGVR
ncbi:SRPBCC family protein [Agromyces bauzanensis]